MEQFGRLGKQRACYMLLRAAHAALNKMRILDVIFNRFWLYRKIRGGKWERVVIEDMDEWGSEIVEYKKIS